MNNWYRLGSSASTSFSGKTTTSGENSVYFTAARTARYFVNASVSKSTVMSIYDCTANTSAYSNSFSSDLNNIGFPVVAGHTYRISTRAYGGESTNVGTFSISITNGNDKIKMYKDIYPFVDKVSIYTKSTSSEYVYFLALKDEEYTFSCRNNTTGGSSTIYASFTLYNTTTKQSVTSFNSLTSKSGEKTYTFTAKAGNIYRIGDQAFYSCTSLTKVIINEGVKSIGSGAFYNCNALTYIYIPSTVTSIGQGALEKCKSLIEITIPFVGGSIKTSADTDQNPLGYLFGTDSGGGVATVQYYYASSTSSSTSKTYYIPMSLKKVTVLGGNILYGAFYNCATIENIILSEGVMSIATSAFKGCSSLSSIIIPNSVTSIGPSAFTDCNNLTIYCEIENKPSGWNNNWNKDRKSVV